MARGRVVACGRHVRRSRRTRTPCHAPRLPDAREGRSPHQPLARGDAAQQRARTRTASSTSGRTTRSRRGASTGCPPCATWGISWRRVLGVGARHGRDAAERVDRAGRRRVVLRLPRAAQQDRVRRSELLDRALRLAGTGPARGRGRRREERRRDPPANREAARGDRRADAPRAHQPRPLPVERDVRREARHRARARGRRDGAPRRVPVGGHRAARARASGGATSRAAGRSSGRAAVRARRTSTCGRTSSRSSSRWRPGGSATPSRSPSTWGPCATRRTRGG